MSLNAPVFPTQNEPEREGKAWLGLLIGLKAGEKLSLGQIKAFQEGSGEIHFDGKGSAELDDGWIGRTAPLG
jgi:hypothetical protein